MRKRCIKILRELYLQTCIYSTLSCNLSCTVSSTLSSTVSSDGHHNNHSDSVSSVKSESLQTTQSTSHSVNAPRLSHGSPSKCNSPTTSHHATSNHSSEHPCKLTSKTCSDIAKDCLCKLLQRTVDEEEAVRELASKTVFHALFTSFKRFSLISATEKNLIMSNCNFFTENLLKFSAMDHVQRNELNVYCNPLVELCGSSKYIADLFGNFLINWLNKDGELSVSELNRQQLRVGCHNYIEYLVDQMLKIDLQVDHKVFC